MKSMFWNAIPKLNTRINLMTSLPSVRRLSAMSTPQIALTPSETLVRKSLLDCRDAMKNEVPGMANLELRFAGGWVRDKLLGTQSHDIDVALSTMTGEQFGEALKAFMSNHEQDYLNEARSLGIPAIIKGLHKIEKNPELSKHLETVTTKMFGLDMDFVNLRKEVYDDLSRNPAMEFGGPEEDAMRRDATVNALFYNLDTCAVEDYTCRGLNDMRERIIRTPLEPYQTFKDDPLRVLRLIRFASRLGYQIDPAAYEAMKDERIHKALQAKISRERVGVEVFKIMGGPDPLCGLMYIFNRDLYPIVFTHPTLHTQPDITRIPDIYAGLQTLLQQQPRICEILRLGDDQTLNWFLATYVPWKNHDDGAVQAAKIGLKASNTFTKVLEGAIALRKQIDETVNNVTAGQISRSKMGTLLRNAGSTWRSYVLFSLLFDASIQGFGSAVSKYTAFLSYLENEHLLDADKVKPILNGNEIKKAMQITQAGPWLKRAIDTLVEWQFDNPNGTVEQAQTMLMTKREELQAA